VRLILGTGISSIAVLRHQEPSLHVSQNTNPLNWREALVVCRKSKLYLITDLGEVQDVIPQYQPEKGGKKPIF